VRGEDGRFVQVTRFEDGVTHARFGLTAPCTSSPRLWYAARRNPAPRSGTLDLKRATTFVPQART